MRQMATRIMTKFTKSQMGALTSKFIVCYSSSKRSIPVAQALSSLDATIKMKSAEHLKACIERISDDGSLGKYLRHSRHVLVESKNKNSEVTDR